MVNINGESNNSDLRCSCDIENMLGNAVAAHNSKLPSPLLSICWNNNLPDRDQCLILKFHQRKQE